MHKTIALQQSAFQPNYGLVLMNKYARHSYMYVYEILSELCAQIISTDYVLTIPWLIGRCLATRNFQKLTTNMTFPAECVRPLC